jgi:hypothetical protein
MEETNWKRVMMALASRGEATVAEIVSATGVKVGTVASLMSQAKQSGAVEKRGCAFVSLVTMSQVHDAARFPDLKNTPTRGPQP